MKTLFDVSCAKFKNYDNHYIVYNRCFNKFNVIIHLKTLILHKSLKYHNEVLYFFEQNETIKCPLHIIKLYSFWLTFQGNKRTYIYINIIT